MVDFTFGDLLSGEEINKLKDRLAGIAEALRKYPQNRLLATDQWWDSVDTKEWFDINPNLNYMSKFIHYLGIPRDRLL